MGLTRVAVLAFLAAGVVAEVDDFHSFLQTRAEISTDSEEPEVVQKKLVLPAAPHAKNHWQQQKHSAQAKQVHEHSGQSLVRTAGRHAGRVHASSDAGSGGMVRLLNFAQAEIIYNNLGGQGPRKWLNGGGGAAAPKEIRYRNLVQGKNVDLVITTEPGYEPFNPSRNGILGGNGQINAKSGTTVPLTFTFVEEGTNTAHFMPKFYITFSDLDERHGGAETETVKVDGFVRYYTNDDLAVVNDNNSVPTFQSSDYGNYDDNEFSPDSPSPTQLSHAVTYLFENRSSFSAIYSVTGDKNKGRNVLFSGISQLVFCQEKSTYLNFSNAQVTVNNLGGRGPSDGPPELRYANIGVKDDTEVLDLVVTTSEPYGYTAWNASQNGLHGEFGRINLFCGPTQAPSEAYATFTIVRSGTNEPVDLEQFAIVVFDFDTGNHEQQIEYVEMKANGAGFEGGNGYSSYITTPSTELAITAAEGNKKRFSATKHGTEADNPQHPQNMARETADKSIVFTFRQTASFTILLGITPTGQDTGRNFMFSGQDMYLMCD